MKTKTTTINSNSYQITQFDAFKGNSILKTLKDSFAASVSEALAFASKLYQDEDEETEVFAKVLGNRELLTKAIISFGDKMSPNEYSEFCLTLLSGTLLNAKEITVEVFRKHYAGNYTELYNVMYEVIAFNFKDFFFESLTMWAPPAGATAAPSS